MDKRNQSIKDQNSKLINTINEFGIEYQSSTDYIIDDNQLLFKYLSDENKKLKLYIVKINKIKELNTNIIKNSIDNDISIEVPSLNSSIELLDDKIKELTDIDNKVKDLISNNKLSLVLPEDDIDDIDNVDTVITYQTITNMEDIKRAFFNKEYDIFRELVKNHKFGYFMVEYDFSHENYNKPEYIAKNLVSGFVRNIEDYNKYFLTCFRCYKNDNAYIYPSLWIVNIDTSDYLEAIENILGSIYHDFIFTELADGLEYFLNEFEKKEINDTLLIEKYVH
jgi:hypothetical protein